MKVLLLVHKDLVPPQGLSGAPPPHVRTEHDVWTTLKESGHEIFVVGVDHSIEELNAALCEWKPDVVFNLLEEFAGETLFESHVVSYLELLKVPYTGCNAKGLLLAKDKAVTKFLLKSHGIPTPDFTTVLKGKKADVRGLKFPLIVKALSEEASRGITIQSVVDSESQLRNQVLRIHDVVDDHAIVEEFIDGREFYLGIMGSSRLLSFPIWELDFGCIPAHWPRVATETIKWREDIQKKFLIETAEARDLSKKQVMEILSIGRKAYQKLGLSGYARMDFRMDFTGKIYFLEANPNPNIGRTEDFARSADKMGIDYTTLLNKILRLGRATVNKDLMISAH